MSTSTNTSKSVVTTAIVGGLLGAMVMAMYAMVASATYKGVGFFTPLYHIASTFTSGQAMMTSMESAMKGNEFFFTFGAALIGMMVHLMVGAGAGMMFGLAMHLRRPSSRVAVAVAGAAYGLLVMVVTSFAVLPIAARVFGGGQAISDMPQMVGWPTFTIEHLMFGTALGLFVAGRTAAEGKVARAAGRLQPAG